MDGNSGKLTPMMEQDKLAKALKEHSDWCSIIGVKGVGTLNKAVKAGRIVDLINISEALHERKYADIADMIYARRDNVRIVFIAGPSSSGKTSTSKRLAIQCRILGLNPKVIELDNYFVSRDRTPRDENGEYDFEALEAMDLELLARQLNQLLDGQEVETKLVGNAMLALDLKEGTHTVQFIYKNAAFSLGWKVSLGCLAVFVTIVFFVYYYPQIKRKGKYESK